jgi:transcriptional regulator with XRE-family HTH domain
MGSIREVLATNLKEYRRISGFSQDKLAELADISSQYLATVETCRKFPTPEVLDKIAGALNIKTYQLFAVQPSPEEAMERLHESIIKDIDRRMSEAVRRAVAENTRAG